MACSPWTRDKALAGQTDCMPSNSPPQYVFRVTFRLDPGVGDVHVSPDEFETTLYRDADRPDDDGWLFFRDNLWRGEIGDDQYFRDLTEDALGVPVTSVSFRELQTTRPYLDDLRAAIADDLQQFNADSVDEALKQHLGSSIRVVDGD